MTPDELQTKEEKPYRPFHLIVQVKKRPAPSSNGKPMAFFHLEQIVAKTPHGEWEEPPERWMRATDLRSFIRGDEHCVGGDCVYSRVSSEESHERHDEHGPYRLVERRYTHDLRLRVKKLGAD